MRTVSQSSNGIMSGLIRIILVTTILVVSLLAERLLRSHVLAAGSPPVVALAAPLAELPRAVGQFHGLDLRADDAATQFADAHLLRRYVSDEGLSAIVWLAYSRDGSDRLHHPEVCMSVAGMPEDEDARTSVNPMRLGAPIQRYRFGNPGNHTWIYYWHYTMRADRPVEQTSMQSLFQTLRYRPASLTVEVFAEDQPVQQTSKLDDFVVRLENVIQDFVGPNAVRGSGRVPVQVIRRD